MPNNQTTKQPTNLFKKFIFFLVFSFLFTQTFTAQLEYWLEFNEGCDIGAIIQTTRANQTIELDISNNSLKNFLNNQMVYKIRKAFPTSNKTRLQHTYIITINPFSGTQSAFMNRSEVRNFRLTDQDSALTDQTPFTIFLPNDYEDALTGGRNTALDLIKAPLAWKYSTGENIEIALITDNEV